MSSFIPIKGKTGECDPHRPPVPEAYYTKRETDALLATKVSFDQFNNHILNTTVHITAEERAAWNNKITEPEEEGSAGDVLVTDGEGGRTWSASPTHTATWGQITGTLSNQTDLHTRLTTDETNISNEVTRATSAEGLLGQRITTETTRATNAESVLTSSIAAEVTRAQGAEATLQINLTAEATTRGTADETLQDNIDAENARAVVQEKKLDDKITSVSSAKTITLHKPLLIDTPFRTFIFNNRLTNLDIVRDLSTLVSPSTMYYYDTLALAVSDANSNITTHSTPQSANTECVLCFDSSGVKVIKLLKSVTVSSTIQNLVPLCIDFNGFTITVTATLGFKQTESLLLYGVKSGSKIVTSADVINQFAIYQNVKAIQYSLYLLGVTIDHKGNDQSALRNFIVYTTTHIYIKGINYTYDNTSGTKLPAFFGARNSRMKMYLELYDSNLTVDLSVGTDSSTFLVLTNCYLSIIKNTKIYVSSVYDNDVTVSCNAISGGISDIDNNVVIIDSDIYGTNSAIATLLSDVYIINSKLSGEGHGGVHPNHKKCYIKDSIIKCTGTRGNNRAAYFTNDSQGYINNCKFVNHNDELSSPVIKIDNTTDWHNTIVKFSNCEMSTIRVDAQCRAYMGLGISEEVKQTPVSGQIIDTETDSYEFIIDYDIQVNDYDLDNMLQEILV